MSRFAKSERRLRLVRLAKNRPLRLLLCCGLFFTLFEGTIRLALSFESVLDLVYVHDDSWMRLKWIHRQRAGVDVYYSFDRFDPQHGWLSKPNLRNFQAFGDQVLNTNSRGFRGLTERSYENPQGLTRIVILGDSYTFGDEVSDEDIYPHHLQEMLPKSEIINLAVHGYGHDQMLLILENEGVKFKPHIVLLGFVYIDIHRNLLRFNDYAKPRFEMRDGVLTLTNVPVPDPQWMRRTEFLRPKAVDLAKMLYHGVEERLGRRNRQARALTVHILDEIVRVTRGVGAEPVFIYLPIEAETNNPQEELLWSEQFLAGYCEARGVIWGTMRRYFRQKVLGGHTFQSKPGGHWYPDGHRTVAEGVKELLEEHRLAVSSDPS